jgi:hypothetical protein
MKLPFPFNSLLAGVAALAVGVCLLVTGCNSVSLAPGGVYANMANGTNIFEAHLAVTTAYAEMDALVSLEASNHAYFAANYPAVVATANTIRANGPKWRDTAVNLIGVYTTNSTAANSNAMATAIAVMTAAAVNSTNYFNLLPK